MFEARKSGEGVIENGVRRLAGKLGYEPDAAGFLVETRIDEAFGKVQPASAPDRLLGSPPAGAMGQRFLKNGEINP